MGNASAKENGAVDESEISDGVRSVPPGSYGVRTAGSLESMGSTSPPRSPGMGQSPLLFTPQAPIAPLQRGSDIPSLFNQLQLTDSNVPLESPLEKGIPTLITWSHGGNEVLVEGSWDNWKAKKTLQKSGKDYSILLVLPSGVYQYRFVVDGELRSIPDLPQIADEKGHIMNLLDVHDYVPENLESVSEFEPPASPDSTYSRLFPVDEDFAKEPPAVPPQLHVSVLGSEEASTKPQHVVLNHLFIEKGWAPQSLVALGLTHRFQSKYVTVVLYKPTRR
ncbi:hypothetical protein J5N97_001701 [Dioscorea zingiberensis]|uniref:Association with the SNF1 complex (ASC) domain-containing protein n=1 Tax=Dioscorea zingiberensis TaxID=325984 RepID=A0A9D5BVM1_9LILI|nr:hypothetical protein J5N97_001701 [Dioscorea zingiberensis]